MPIPVTCACSASFAAGDHLAGKTVQCPKCKQPLAIPAAVGAGAGGSGAAAGPSIFDQAGIKGLAAGQQACPQCEAVIASNAVLCVKCGYHLKLGKKLAGHATAKKGGGDGHADTAEDMLEKARQAIDEEKEAKAAEMQEGMPWYGMLGIFLFTAGFLAMMILLPNDTAFSVAGSLVILICGVGNLYYNIRVIMAAFQENLAQGLMVLFVPFYALIFIVLRWDKCGAYFIMSLILSLVSLVGAGMIAIAPMLKPSEKDDEDARLLSPPAIVRTYLA